MELKPSTVLQEKSLEALSAMKAAGTDIYTIEGHESFVVTTQWKQETLLYLGLVDQEGDMKYYLCQKKVR